MYTEFFGLREAPFNSTQDPKFFFPSPQHEEALACLVYAVQERKGLVVVTGDVGSGKSLVTHMLVNRLGNTAETAVLSTSHLTGTDLLQGICREFQMPLDADFNTMEVLATLEDYLLALSAKERGTVLIVDDAHALSETNLEQLRLVSNLEVAGGKLLQIVLSGQPDLNQLLQRSSSKQLRQRVFRNFHITRLSSDLTKRYIQFRLEAAGLPNAKIFDDQSIELVHQYADGIPRLINNLCDNLLLSAYSDNVAIVDRQRVNAVIDEMMSVPESSASGLADGCPDDVEQAISEITNQYVRSLEAQIGELESASADTDQRIHELHRLSAKLQAQELKLSEHQPVIDAKIRDLHRLTVTLAEQEQSLSQREKALAQRVEELQALSERLDSQDSRMAEREAKLAQQLRDVQRLSATLVQQDTQLTERANFIDKKLANRQVSFDRELNECKRAINRKWEVIKQLIVQYETKENSRTKRLASVDQRLQQFEKIESHLQERESSLKQSIEQASETLEGLSEASSKMDDAGAHLHQLIEKAGIVLNQPQQIMAKAARQMEQVDRMTKIVQKATDALQKTVQESVESSKQLTAEGKELSERLEGIEDDAVASLKELEDRCGKTHGLREALRQIYEQSHTKVKDLKELVAEAEKVMARLPKQLEQLRDNTVHPARLMKELRSVGSAAERNLHDGQVRLAELRAMIERANKARKSIEALMNATRQVANNRRASPVGRAGKEGVDITGSRTPDPLASKIDSLTEAVRKAGGRSGPNLTSVRPSDANHDARSVL